MTSFPRLGAAENSTLMAIQITSASKDAYKNSFFPRTIMDWDDFPDSLISSSDLSEDRVSKFTYLVRARG